MHIRPPRPLTAPFSTNLQIRKFLGSLQRLSHDINGGEHITIWPHPIGFANGTKRLNWIKDFPYLAEYSYFAECFRENAPGRMWAGSLSRRLKVGLERKCWLNGMYGRPLSSVQKHRPRGRNCSYTTATGKTWTLATVAPERPSLSLYSTIFEDRKRCRSRNCGVPATIRKPLARISA
ncbi:hypothetical protein B0H14DRAFT_299834 [Mycena olivaceomarginata]|nr:hypothetical protein B0H14DRAFT_299834 [Mycena olivaceomarginata]